MDNHKPTYTCRCKSVQTFSRFAQLHPDAQIVETCTHCGRKNIGVNHRIVEFGRLPTKDDEEDD